MNLQVINVSGIDGYEKDGVVYLKLETVARGLGFTTTQIIKETEYVNVRWNRVDEYLAEIGFATSGKRPEYIPENVFYRLAMKAKNEAAERFQAKIADEVIPSIRKTGSYRSLPVSPAEQLLAQAQLMVEQERRLKAVEEKTQATQETVQSAFSALSHPTVSRDHWQDETRSQIRRMCLENGLNYQTHTAKLYEELESEAHVNLETRVKRLRDRMKAGGAKYAERQAVNKLTVIAQDQKLRSIFSSVIQRRYAQLVTEKLSAM